ncbi:MAG TPA: hypothetical protein VFQ22_00550 [Longimicrobiales bacterium]|nr:hypothetical protein [Longimicrobiales bacterium]
MAAPRLLEVASRLRMARHHAAFEDLLDDPTPRLVLQLTPWAAPFSAASERFGAGVFELALERRDTERRTEEQVVVRTRVDCVDRTEILGERQIAVARLTAPWLEAVVLDFVREVLARA